MVKESIVRRLADVRERTLWLLDEVPEEFLRRRVHDFYSPIGWHFGHVGRTEEYWVLGEALGRPLLDEHLSFLFADLPENPKDNRVNIPDRSGIAAYLGRTRERVLSALEAAELAPENPLLEDGYAWEFAIQHECQHQETICEMLQLIQKCLPHDGDRLTGDPFNPAHPVGSLRSFAALRVTSANSGGEHPCSASSLMADIPGGSFVMGSDDRHVYDNERVPHQVDVRPFRMATTPVTACQWGEFIAEEGYSRPELWSAEGWAWVQREGAEAPEYWRSGDEGWSYVGPRGLREILCDEPVSAVSWYEADAYARWKGKRLPTEEEWEYAACAASPVRYPWGDEAPCDGLACHGMTHWGPTPAGQRRPNGFGLHDMAGNVWEWTSSPFLPYPGFAAYPYDGYSKDHMKGAHRVCRGGSWATSPSILRRTFRNWYVPGYRQGFLGVRLVEDA